MSEHHQKLHTQLAKVLRDTSSLLSQGEKAEVKEYIQASDYDTALETLIDMLSETGKPLPASVMNLLTELADSLELGADACAPLRKLGKC